jgi:2-hydroxychromene-2-carboxylate isomerase
MSKTAGFAAYAEELKSGRKVGGRALLRSIVAAAGAAPARVAAARDRSTVTASLDAWQRQAIRAGVRGVPTFFVGRRGGSLQPLGAGVPPVDSLRAVLDGALR